METSKQEYYQVLREKNAIVREATEDSKEKKREYTKYSPKKMGITP